MILTPQNTQAIAASALSATQAPEARIWLRSETNAFTRFANNEATQSGVAENVWMSVHVAFGNRHAAVETNDLSQEGISAAVRKAEEAARLAPEDQEYVPELGPQNYPAIDGYVEATAAATAATRAQFAKAVIERAKAKGLDSSGYLEQTAGTVSIATKRGLQGYYRYSQADFSATVRTKDGTGSGWSAGVASDIGELDPEKLAATAVEKALLSAKPRTLKPGKYTVISEPQATANLLSYFAWSLDGRAAVEGRSFFSAKGGGTKAGEQIFSDLFTLRSDAATPAFKSAPFDDQGVPQVPISWVEAGQLKNLHFRRDFANWVGAKATPALRSMTMQGRDNSLEALIKGIKSGVLVTRFWYTNFVNPENLLLTGLTRDGTFFIENGTITYPVKNMRFNESLVHTFTSIKALSAPVRTPIWDDSIMAPAVIVEGFNFSSESAAT